MTKYRTYKYLIKPTTKQKEIITKTLECCTFVYNKYICENGFELYKKWKAIDILSKYKNEHPFLCDVDISALMNTMFDIQNSKNVNLKTRNTTRSYTTTNLSGRQAIYFVSDDYINIPKLANVKIVKHRDLPINSKIINATIKKDSFDEYYLCITFSHDVNNNNRLNIEKSIGLDYSSKNMYIDSNGNSCNMPHFYHNQEKRLAFLNQVLAKCEKDSKHYREIINKIRKINKKIQNQRADFLHKESSRLANEYDVICVEDLDMNEIAGHYKLAKNTYDNGYGMFLDFLKYKLEDRGKVLIKVSKYYPSSKICHVCGYIKENLMLSEREWICPKCGTKHNRDINAYPNFYKIQTFKNTGLNIGLALS